MGCGRSKVVPFSPENSIKNQSTTESKIKDIIAESVQSKLSKYDESYPTFAHQYYSSNESLTFRHEFQYAPAYSIKDISIFNAKLGYIQIFPYRNIVCCASKFKKMVIKTVKLFEKYKQEMYCDTKIETVNFKQDFTINPLFYIWSHGLRMKVIQKFLIKCKVANLRCLSKKEKWEDERADVDLLYNDLKNHKLTEYQTEYMEMLIRYEEKYHALKGIPEKLKVIKHDINKDPFPLPSNIETNQGLLRSWIESWEVFDTEVPEEGPWELFETNLIPNDDEECVNEAENPEFPELIFTIEGEVAWDVIEADIIKKDVSTEQQDKIWELRSKRKDLDDPERMKRRRSKLDKYFTTKYNFDSAKLDSFKEFTNILQTHWKIFQKLCENG